MMADSFSITLSSLIGPWPCWWVRDERGGGVGGSKVFLHGLKLASPTHRELVVYVCAEVVLLLSHILVINM